MSTTTTTLIELEIEQHLIARALEPVRCHQCGVVMEQTCRNEIHGWYRWDCPRCRSRQERRP